MVVDGLCGTRFWNSSVSWETESPIVSKCFQHLILVIASCSVLWIVAPFEFIKICRTIGNPSPWSRLSKSKFVLNIILLQICTLDLATALYSYLNYPDYGLDGMISAASYFVTIVLTIILTLMCKNRGIRVSLALPSFWMISTITTLISLYNDIENLNTEDWRTIVCVVDDSLSFFISLIQLVMSTFADHKPNSRGRESKDSCPLEASSLPSRLTFSWIISLLKKSVDNSLHQDHLIPLCSEHKSAYVARRFEKICKTYSRQQTRLTQVSENCSGNDSAFESQEENVEYGARYPEGKSLFFILFQISRKSLTIAALMETIYTALYFLPVYILSIILDEGKRSKDWHNYVYSTALFLALLFASFANSQRKYFGLTGALQIKTAVINAVFTKALNVSEKSQSVKNFITVEADNIFQAVCIMSDVWGSPIRLIIGIYILWSFIGPSCFVGILAACLLIPINVIVDYYIAHFQKNAGDRKRELIDLLSECLHGMKALKLYAWEEFFLKKLMLLRKSELGKLRKATVLKMIFKFLFLSATLVITLVISTAYVLMEHSIDVKTIFLAYFIIYLLKTPFQSLLFLLAYFIEGIASVKRVQRFLETEELEKTPTQDYSEGNSVTLSNASFSWNGLDEPCLKNLSIRIPKGSLIAVVGEKGSGKSSLLRALLGEMRRVEGEASVKGEIAFVAQKSWIQNTTVEKNIVFLRNKENDFYQRTLEACALTAEIESLPAGEETEIGLKGIPLSVEQKLKVDLARAVYQNADLYIFDDPLKHLDTFLAEHLYHRVIGRSGLLNEKTRIFLTRSKEFLPLVDSILFLKDGRIVEQGTYTELTEKNSGHFLEYLKTTSSSVKEQILLNVPERHECENLWKQNDLWCSAAISPATIELENAITNDVSIASKGLGSKLTDYLKIVGFCLTTAIILVAGLACFCEVTSGVWLSKWTDRNGNSAEHNLLLYAGIVLSQIFLTVTCGVVLFASSTMAAGKLHTWLLHQIMRASQMIFETTPIQNMRNSFDLDFHYVDERIPETIYVWLLAVLKVPALLVIIFIVSPFLAVLLIPLVYVFLVIQQHYLTSWQQLQHLTVATNCPLLNLIEDTLQGISHIRAAGTTSHFFNRFHTKLDTHNNCSFLFLVVSRWLSCVLDITTALLVLVTAISAFREQEQGNRFIVLAIMYAMQLGDTLTTVVYASSLLNADLTPFERIMSFSQIKQESEWEDPANRPPASWPESGLVSVQNLSTAYGEGMYPFIHNINLSVKPREKVAIIGKEESGIYTFLYSLFRLIEPSHGSIVIDNIDIHKLGLRDLRSRLAIIPQETVIFKGSVRHNLDPGQMHTDNELQQVLETVNLISTSSFTSLDCIVDEQMSLEEKYLLSIARCLLKKPKIVVIDEQELPDPRGRTLFQDSTILSFSERPLPDHSGRTIKFMSGEIVSQDFPSTTQRT